MVLLFSDEFLRNPFSISEKLSYSLLLGFLGFSLFFFLRNIATTPITFTSRIRAKIIIKTIKVLFDFGSDIDLDFDLEFDSDFDSSILLLKLFGLVGFLCS